MMRVLPTTSRVDVMVILTSISILQVAPETQLLMAFWNSVLSETLVVVTAKERWGSISCLREFEREFGREFGRFGREYESTGVREGVREYGSTGVREYGREYGGTLSFELPVIEGVCVCGGGLSHWFDWS